MPIVKVGTRCQVTIPKEIAAKIELNPGDYVEVTLEDGKIIMKAVEDAWFWSKEWQEKEREADEAIAKGEVIGPFKSAQEGLKALKKTKL